MIRRLVLAVNDSIATALVTGQTADVAVEHAAVLQPPTPPDMRARKDFWAGIAASALAGFLLGRLI